MERPISRARWLQETRTMRFQEVYTGWQERRLTQEDAGQLLGVSARTFRRQIGRFEADGMQGLVDLRMSQVSSRRAPVDEVLGLQRLYDSEYSAKELAKAGITDMDVANRGPKSFSSRLRAMARARTLLRQITN